MNTFRNELEKFGNVKNTENGAVAYGSTLSNVYDMFAFGGAYRQRSESDICTLFANAYKENKSLAVKCLFYLGDVRGGKLFA